MSARSFRRAREREISRRSKAVVAAGAGLGATVLFAPAASADTFTVTKLADSVDGTCDADCSLREAVYDANDLTGDDVVTFASGLTGTITLATGDIDVYDGGLQIQGPGANLLTVSGDDNDRIFKLTGFIVPGEDVSISGLTLADGNVSSNDFGGALYSDDQGGFGADLFLSDMAFTGNEADGGGAIWAADGSLSIVNSQFSNNEATSYYGGALYAADNDGGTGPGVAIRNSTFTGNIADDGGGAVHTDGAIGGVVIEGSTFTGNDAGTSGGALYTDETDGAVTIQGSTITGNSAGDDGGGAKLYHGTGDVTIADTTIADNFAADNGGGATLYDNDGVTTIERTTFASNRADERGGGMTLWGNGGPAVIQNSTISGNRADADGDGSGYGGGFVSFDGSDETRALRNSTVVNNTSTDTGGGIHADLYDNAGPPDAVFTISSSIVANNTAPTGPDLSVGEATDIGTFQIGHSLIRTPGTVPIAESPAGSNLTGVDPLLGPLASNGGATQTHLQANNSPAVDAGISSGLTTDQRGLPRTAELSAVANRPGSDATDIGAVEIQTASCQGAFVPTKIGTEAGETIDGTEEADSIAGNGGDDRLRALGGKDCADGGAGRDRVDGGKGKDKVKGGAGKDVVKGGKGKDKLKGNAGKDKLKAADGKKDKVNCGGGKDKATVDAKDRVARSCEDVTVRSR